MAEDSEDSNGLEMTILKSLANVFSKYTTGDVAPLSVDTTQSNLTTVVNMINSPQKINK